jgi:hypothetical protein
LFNPEYKVRVREFKYSDPAVFLPASLCRQQYSKVEKFWREKSGVELSNLRPHDYVDPKQKVVFEKYFSRGEYKDKIHIN